MAGGTTGRKNPGNIIPERSAALKREGTREDLPASPEGRMRGGAPPERRKSETDPESMVIN